jgi:hypothetical protein
VHFQLVTAILSQQEADRMSGLEEKLILSGIVIIFIVILSMINNLSRLSKINDDNEKKSRLEKKD